MRLIHQSLLPYQGFHGTEGLCHIRAYEGPGRLPVVIAGALDDGPGTSITNAIEMVAAAIQARLFADGREFELIEHYPRSFSGDPVPSFMRVRFTHRSRLGRRKRTNDFMSRVVTIVGDSMHVTRGAQKPSRFRNPSWEPIADIEQYLDCEVRLWPPGEYTARAVAGGPGQTLRDEIAARTEAINRRLLDAIGP